MVAVWSRCFELRCDAFSGITLHSSYNVTVYVKGHGDRGMAEALLDHFRVNAITEGKRGPRVAEPVKGESCKLPSSDSPLDLT